MVLFLTSADASAANGGGSMLVMMIVLIAVFYFFMIRPENKRKKEAQAMRDAIKVGDNITTIGGIIGDVVSVKDDSIVIETSADRVRVEPKLPLPARKRRQRSKIKIPAAHRREFFVSKREWKEAAS